MDMSGFFSTPSWELILVVNLVVLLFAAPALAFARRQARKSIKHDPQSGVATTAALTAAGWYIKPLSYAALTLINGYFAYQMWLIRDALMREHYMIGILFAVLTVCFFLLALKRVFSFI